MYLIYRYYDKNDKNFIKCASTKKEAREIIQNLSNVSYISEANDDVIVGTENDGSVGAIALSETFWDELEQFNKPLI
jgi:hypothetical protein